MCLDSNFGRTRGQREKCRGRMTGVKSTYPKSSREYMSAKKDNPAPERGMKGGVKEGDYGGEGEVLARNWRVPHILLAKLEL